MDSLYNPSLNDSQFATMRSSKSEFRFHSGDEWNPENQISDCQRNSTLDNTNVENDYENECSKPFEFFAQCVGGFSDLT